MTKSNSATSRIHLLPIQTQCIATIHGHGSKRLIDFHEVNIAIEVEVELSEKFRDGDGGADAHDTWGETGESCGDVFGENGLLEFEGFGAFHENEGCGAICDLGTVAGGTAVTVLWKGTGEFGDFLVGGAVADFVFGNGRFLAIQSDGDGD